MKLNCQALYNIFIFVFLMLVSIFAGASLKNEILWDFTNYHYYNAWAFFNNRLNFDIVTERFLIPSSRKSTSFVKGAY